MTDSYARYRSRWIPAFAGMTILLLLTACAAPSRKPDTYTDRAGGTTVIETNKESCISACNADYSRCMDTQAAQSSPVAGSPSGMFGASADCQRDLRRCLPECRGR